MSKKETLKRLIIDFENGVSTVETAVERINEISYLQIDKDFLANYWRSMDLSSFTEILATPQIKNWIEIDDEYADELITEIKNNLTNDAIFKRNATALEKRYKKSAGTISDWIFQKDIMDNNELLRLLKLDTSIKL
ncbi:hypothetical protein [Maribacter sp. R77961]|uniref:hypothetical protein n=1 Tax=Maribacter sp. R77961 TaxID=3093871 RepID=UPI0037CB1760